jgi:phage terminase large subunit-like protein
MEQVLETRSEAYCFKRLPLKVREPILAKLTKDESLELFYDWDWWARPTQLPPINKFWHIWMVLAGRGYGKTRTGAEYIRDQVEDGYDGRIHLIGPTAADVRDIMIEGESGILAVCPPWNKPRYEPTKRRVTWPNGARITTFSAEIPDRLRGPQCGLIWADEVASWQYPEDTWDMAMFGFRKGTPKAVITATPRPIPLIKDLIKTKGVVVTKGNSYENRDNLADVYFDTIIKKYEGTRLGEQEIYAKILEDTPGALWTLDNIAQHRCSYADFQDIELVRIAVAIDPAVSAKVTSNETGIIAGGIDANGEGYVLADGSGIMSPIAWAKQAIKIFAALKADRIVAEVNNGGDLVEANLRTVHPNIPYTKVHASRGKRIRAEPISSLYEQGLVHHVGVFPALEDQLTTWDATDGSTSPDRLDALVWLMTFLMLGIKLKKATGRRS